MDIRGHQAPEQILIVGNEFRMSHHHKMTFHNITIIVNRCTPAKNYRHLSAHDGRCGKLIRDTGNDVRKVIKCVIF